MIRALWPSRKFMWVSATDERAWTRLKDLQRAMTDWYSTHADYYGTIDFTRDNWIFDAAYAWIIEATKDAQSILEIGCGRANILSHYPLLASRYTGVDFSEELIQTNSKRFPDARFGVLQSPFRLDFESARFDLVISVFVLEHCVYPHLALDEWVRVLKTGGRLLILCPDFLGRGLISSQRVGFSEGTGREKLARGKFLDAMMTGVDTRLRMPIKTYICRRKARQQPQFFVNLAPTCFEDSFRPDVDAVYLTYEPEIISWLNERMSFVQAPPALRQYVCDRRMLAIQGRKR